LDESEVDRRLEAFKEASRRAGIKLTHQRIEIFREVAKTENHPDAETILKGVRARVPEISLDTVYRTLKTLEQLKVISRVHVWCEPARFDANMEIHHHCVCIRCGSMKDFASHDLDTVPIPEHVQDWGEVQSIHIEVRSICSACAMRDRD
jgi:Fur family transcriptional regulator, peroxide stress response regulator